MEPCVNLYEYFVGFFLDWKCLRQRLLKKLKHFIFKIVFQKFCVVGNNVEKYDSARQVSDDNINAVQKWCDLHAG
jgi:hypothetical protein